MDNGWNRSQEVSKSAKMLQLELECSMMGVETVKLISLSRPEDGTSSSIQVDGTPTLTLADKVYTKNTGNISKKESRDIAAKNKSMKDWLTPSRRLQTPSTAERYMK